MCVCLKFVQKHFPLYATYEAPSFELELQGHLQQKQITQLIGRWDTGHVPSSVWSPRTAGGIVGIGNRRALCGWPACIYLTGVKGDREVNLNRRLVLGGGEGGAPVRRGGGEGGAAVRAGRR